MFNCSIKNQKLKVLALAVLCSVFAFLKADVEVLQMKKVFDLYYSGDMSELKDSTIHVPTGAVAVSGTVKIDMPTDTTISIGGTPSILFIIDHSGSMCYNYGGGDPDRPQDQWGQRFAVTYDFIDTLRRKFPASEVSVVVFREHQFFNPPDNRIYVKHPQYPDGGYIPFFKLDSLYAYQGGKSGSQILQELMKTDTILGDNDPLGLPYGYTSPGYKYLSLKYWPTNYNDNMVGTNINVGFDVAKVAFQSALYPRDRQFIIFFSDGDATYSNGPHGVFDEDYYVKGDSVPTTFTIFFAKNGTVPQNLLTMTTNIRNNGYSMTNPKSNAWDINLGQNDLKKFLMDTIMTIINTVVIGKPVSITINNTSISNYDTANNQFIFKSHFPLTGVKTDFAYKISYTIVRDSIKPNGDTIHVMYDSTNAGSFSVVVDPNISVPPNWYPDTFALIGWEREIVFFYNNAQISEVNETMNPVELRFNVIPGDKKYDYTKVDIELTNKTGAALDKETYKLSKSGTTFSGKFPTTVIAANAFPTVGDGILQHYAVDTIVATFRNNETTKLPLDTLQEIIPCKLLGSIRVIRGEYWDLDADGYVDSIYVAATTDLVGGLTNAHVAEIVDSALSLPNFRGFTVNGSGVSSGGFHIDVSEDKAHNPVTYVTSDDVLRVTQEILSVGGWVEGVTAPIYDKVAPILHWEPKSALLKDYQVSSKSDTLGVKFSEPVKSVSSDEPFYFLNRVNNTNYVVKLLAAGHPKPDSLVFHVNSVTGVAAMQDGDSLWIHEINRIADDTAGNFQNNTKNIKRKLYVKEIFGPVTIECGYYYDNNADGYVDSIYVKATTEIEGGLTDARVQEIVQKAITLPAFRGFMINSSGIVTGGFFIKVTENKGHNPFTYVSNDDKLIVSTYTLSMGGEIVGGTLPVYDRVAPLIHWEARAAYLIDFMDPATADTLFIKFSEPVKRVTDDVSFYFLDQDNHTEYTVNLADVSQPETGKMAFSVTSVSNVDYMEDGDTVWIHETDRVCDVEGNYQNNNMNTRRRLYVKRVVLPYTFVPQAVSPVSVQSLTTAANRVPAEIMTVLGSEGILTNLNLQKNASGDYCGMIIMVVPDPENIGQLIPDLKIQATLTMLDAVGNTLVLKANLAWWDQRKSLVWVWNLKNRNGRVVGPGMYVCLFEIEDITESLGYQNKPQKTLKKITIGVK